MQLRIMKPNKGHRGIVTEYIDVYSLSNADIRGFALAQAPLTIVDLIDSTGKILKRYDNHSILQLNSDIIQDIV